MGLLDKWLQDDWTQFGMSILGNNHGYNGAAFPVLGAAAADFNNKRLQQQKLQEAEEAKKAREQWYIDNGLNPNAPDWAAQESFKLKLGLGKDTSTSAMKEYALAVQQGYKGTFQDYQTQMKQAGATTINNNLGNNQARMLTRDQVQGLGLDQSLPWFWDKNGEPKTVKKTNYTEGQLSASNFAEMMAAAEDELSGLTALGYDPSTISKMIAEKGGIVGNAISDPDSQAYVQAMKTWVRAKLRKESGAVIGDEEMAEEFKTYFPQPGDSSQVIAQKARMRQQALEGMARMSGGAYEYAAPVAPKNTPRQPTVKPEETKTVAGKTYVKINGSWYAK